MPLPKPQAGDRVTYFNPKVLKGKLMTGVLEDDAFEGRTVFMPDEAFHPALEAAFLEPEAGLYLDGSTVTVA